MSERLLSQPVAVSVVHQLVCPECGERATALSPVQWVRAWGPQPGYCHEVDRTPLCPVINIGDGVVGYVPAAPVTATEYDDANGCPCDVTFTCGCACTGCSCRTDAALWRHLDQGTSSGQGLSDAGEGGIPHA